MSEWCGTMQQSIRKFDVDRQTEIGEIFECLSKKCCLFELQCEIRHTRERTMKQLVGVVSNLNSP